MSEISKPSINNELVLYRLDQIDKKLNEMSAAYVTKTEFQDAIQSLEKDVNSLRRQKSFISWVVPIITAVITTFVILTAEQAFFKD
jgi:hypothetical protein